MFSFYNKFSFELVNSSNRKLDDRKPEDFVEYVYTDDARRRSNESIVHIKRVIFQVTCLTWEK